MCVILSATPLLWMAATESPPPTTDSAPRAAAIAVATANVPAAKGDAYAAYLRRTGVTECRGTPGNRGVEVLRRTVGGETHFLFISFWDSMEAIGTFAGDDVERAHYYPEDRDYLLELEPTVQHYEVSEQ